MHHFKSLTQKQKLNLSRRSLAVRSKIFVDHLAPLHGSLVLGTQCAAHVDIIKEFENSTFSRRSSACSCELSQSQRVFIAQIEAQ